MHASTWAHTATKPPQFEPFCAPRWACTEGAVIAKVGTAHVEIKPVLNEAELERICKVIEESVAAAISRSMKVTYEPRTVATATVYNGLCTCRGPLTPHPFHEGSPGMRGGGQLQ